MFIKLTLKDNRRILINKTRIDVVAEPYGGEFIQIYLSDETASSDSTHYDVLESFDEVEKLLN